jgi:signal transduction histidine kinase
MDSTLTYIFSSITALGVVAIVLQCYYGLQFIKQNQGASYINTWRMRFSIVLGTALLYLLILWFFAHDYFSEFSVALILCGSFFIGGLFALVDTFIAQKTFQEVQTSNVALANANVNMAQLYTQLDELTTSLEIQKNTLHQAYQDLQTTQKQMIQMEKLAALGQLVAGIAHEINTPMGAINASSTYISELLQVKFPKISRTLQEINHEELELLNNLVTTSLNFKGSISSKEYRMQRKRIQAFLDDHDIAQSEEIASLMAEMHVYEGIENFLPSFKDPNFLMILNTAYSLSSIYENSKTIEISTHKVKKIIFALKNFAHFDRSDKMSKFDLKQNIENVVTLYQNQMKYGVNLQFHYDDAIPIMVGYPDELGQVWTNLMHNALQAMDFVGSLSIDVTQDVGRVYVSITDSGTGIDKAIEGSVFLPFFTTKAVGEGSGLGLHIVKQIVEEKHDGKISFKSMPGKTTFTVELPKAKAELLENEG